MWGPDMSNDEHNRFTSSHTISLVMKVSRREC